MNSPNYPPGGPQGPYGPPQGQPYGGPPPQTPPGGQPYGGPPPQGQSFGGPAPQGQPFGAPPPQGPGGPGGPAGPGGTPPVGYATPPPPPPAAKPSNKGKFIKIGIGVVVIAVIAVFAVINWGKSASSAAVGDCIKVNNASSVNADVEKIDCNDPNAAYKVAATYDDSSASCPDADNSNYVSYTESGRGDLTLCLILNAKEGECFAQGDADKKVDCASSEATFKVTKVLTGTTDPAGCPEGTEDGYVYAEPPTVQCFGAPTGEQT
jgi:hypothetical protein